MVLNIKIFSKLQCIKFIDYFTAMTILNSNEDGHSLFKLSPTFDVDPLSSSEISQV